MLAWIDHENQGFLETYWFVQSWTDYWTNTGEGAEASLGPTTFVVVVCFMTRAVRLIEWLFKVYSWWIPNYLHIFYLFYTLKGHFQGQFMCAVVGCDANYFRQTLVAVASFSCRCWEFVACGIVHASLLQTIQRCLLVRRRRALCISCVLGQQAVLETRHTLPVTQFTSTGNANNFVLVDTTIWQSFKAELPFKWHFSSSISAHGGLFLLPPTMLLLYHFLISQTTGRRGS